MELTLRDVNDSIIVPKVIFGRELNYVLIHQVVVSYLAGKRQGSKAQKNRSEVSGSGKKPWRQKGTGRARAGSLRSPLWRSGGVTFAAKPKNYSQKVNKKMYQGALRSIFSELIRQKRLFVFKEFIVDLPKTKILLNKLKDIKIKDVLILVDTINSNLFYAARNLYKVCVLNVHDIDPVSLVSFKNIVITVPALKKIEGILSC